MSSSYDSKKPKFTDMMRASLSPREPIEYDPKAPNPIPRSLKISGVLAIIAGVINTALAVYWFTARDSFIQQLKDQIAQCKADGIGVGAAVTSTEDTPAVNLCRALVDFTEAQYEQARGQVLILVGVLLVVGIGLIVSGYFVAKGSRWARLALAALATILLIATMMQVISNLLILLTTFLALIATMLTFIGQGANYFIREKMKQQRAGY